MPKTPACCSSRKAKRVDFSRNMAWVRPANWGGCVPVALLVSMPVWYWVVSVVWSYMDPCSPYRFFRFCMVLSRSTLHLGVVLQGGQTQDACNILQQNSESQRYFDRLYNRVIIDIYRWFFCLFPGLISISLAAGAGDGRRLHSA